MLLSPHQFRSLTRHLPRKNMAEPACFEMQGNHCKRDLQGQTENHGKDKRIRHAILYQMVLVSGLRMELVNKISEDIDQRALILLVGENGIHSVRNLVVPDLANRDRLIFPDLHLANSRLLRCVGL